MTPMCRSVSKGARREVDELDDTDCQLETDVWDDMCGENMPIY